MFKAFSFVMLAIAVANLAAIAGLFYVAIHFINKFW